MKIILLLIALLCLPFIQLSAQIAKTQVVRVKAVDNPDGTITLSWPAETFAGTFDIYKRLSQSTEDWGSNFIGSVPGSQNSYTDASFKKGEAFEYLVAKTQSGTSLALGYVYAGNQTPEPNKMPGIILLIDSNFLIPLSAEINRLSNALQKEGWVVTKLAAGRKEAVPAVKSRIVAAYQSASIKPASLFIIGHVPVPYSGYYSATGDAPPPDGHIEGSGNHTGAWPADVYYGILEDLFTDNSVECTSGAQTRNHNIMGDGKFDQTKLPGNTTLEVGRLDLFNMPAFGKSDTLLTLNYLNRNYTWRTGSWKVRERALIDNNFGTLNLASTGYANFAPLLGLDSVFDNRDYMISQKTGSYLWSYGCGAGSYTTCSGIGNTANFVNDSFENVFTILAGSFFGDWDVQNNYLKAPVASKSLASFWGGIPKWYVHHMGLGDRIGKGTKITQNNKSFYFNGSFNGSSNSMHIALMGDPSLRMRNLPHLQSLTAISENKLVKLNWPALGDTSLSYAVYRVDTVLNEYARINPVPIKDTFYVDAQNYQSGNYLYAVKPIRLEKTASGSYYNTGGAAFARVNHVNGIHHPELGSHLILFPNPIQPGGSFQINALFNTEGSIQISVYDLGGKECSTQSFSTHAGNNRFILNAVPTQAGMYIIRLESEGIQYHTKLLVQ